MEQKKQDYYELLEDTVKFYSEDINRRAILKGTDTCAYRGKNNTKCAVGRWIADDLYDDDFEFNGVHSLVCESRFKSIDEILVEDKQGFNIDFWSKLQDFHDDSSNWGEATITTCGREEITAIKVWIENRFVAKDKNN